MMTSFESNSTLLHQYTIRLLTRLFEAKFAPSRQTTQAIIGQLQALELGQLETLFTEIIAFQTINQFQAWLKAHLPQPAPPLLSQSAKLSRARQLMLELGRGLGSSHPPHNGSDNHDFYLNTTRSYNYNVNIKL